MTGRVGRLGHASGRGDVGGARGVRRAARDDGSEPRERPRGLRARLHGPCASLRGLRASLHGIGVLVLVGTAACKTPEPTDPGTGTGRVLEIVAGNAQTGEVGRTLGQPLVVRVLNGGTQRPEAGIAVAFGVVDGGGRVSAASVTTAADGTAQVEWTLGPPAGAGVQRVRAVLTGASGSPATFTVLARPGAPARLVPDSASTGQRAAPGVTLPVPIAVQVRDSFGNGVPGATVQWQVAQGGGSVLPASSAADTAGRAATSWTLGSVGSQQLKASLAGPPAVTTTVSALAIDLAVTGADTDTLRIGRSVTLSGRGFGTDAGRVRVTVGGAAAAITAVAGTSLTFTVPSVCRPLGPVNIVVVVDGATAAPFARAFRPGDVVLPPPGELTLITDPAQFCVQFPATTADEAYLVGILNTVPDPLDLRTVVLDAAAGELALASRTLRSTWTEPAPVRGTLTPPGASARDARLRRHRLRELELRERDRPLLAQRRSAVAGPARPAMTLDALPATAAVGDTIRVRYSFGGCTLRALLTTVVRHVGVRGLWLEDVANPAGGLTTADYQQLGRVFDDQVYAVDAGNWGAPTDLDGNGRIAVVVTKEVNKEAGLLGFVTAADFLPAAGTSGCERSNQGEFYYAIAPDPQNADPARRYTREMALADAPLLLAHEVTHVIQFGRRLSAGQAPLELWEAEGGATLSEQLNGFAADGLAERGNYGLNVAYSAFDPARVAWYADAFTDLAQHYGFACAQRSSDGTCVQFGKVAGAPNECGAFATFAVRDYASMGAPCQGVRTAYGTPSLLLRYVADQYGDAYGGTPRLLQDLIGSGAVGLANLTGRIGVPADRLLAEFWATLYVDDRVPTSMRLRLPTWNLTNIFEGSVTAAGGETRSLRPESRLVPAQRAFGAFTDRLAVRGGGSSYTVISGAGRPGVALGVRSVDGTPAPGTLRVWVVRLR
jgi:hypothetical protein